MEEAFFLPLCFSLLRLSAHPTPSLDRYPPHPPLLPFPFVVTMLDARTLTATPHGACTVSMLTLIGGVVALSSLVRLFRGIWVYFLRPGKDLKKLGEFGERDDRGTRGREGAARRGDGDRERRARPAQFLPPAVRRSTHHARPSILSPALLLRLLGGYHRRHGRHWPGVRGRAGQEG